MSPKIRHKAKVLLIELESLRECKAGANSIQTFALLEEVLKDASCLAKQVNNAMPGSLDERNAAVRAECARVNALWNEASKRSSASMERSRALLVRQGVNRYED